MEKIEAVSALAALAQETRLDVFRLLVQAGPDGLPAGQTFRRESRSLIYAAEFAAMNGLLAYLTENCCGGQNCAPCCEPADRQAADRQAAA